MTKGDLMMAIMDQAWKPPVADTTHNQICAAQVAMSSKGATGSLCPPVRSSNSYPPLYLSL